MPDADTGQDNLILKAAADTFRDEGFASATLEQVAQRAKVPVSLIQDRYTDKSALFEALLKAHSPLPDLLLAFDEVQGESAEDILRDAMRNLVKAVDKHDEFIELAALDMQVNNGAFVS